MAKKKFIERRRQKCREDRTKSIDARDYRSSVVGLLTEMGVEFETHECGSDEDGYCGFKLSYDPAWDRTWYIVKNPHGGSDLELAVEYGFDVMFGHACWSFRPTLGGYQNFCEMIKAVLSGNAAAVSCLVGGEEVAVAILARELLNEQDMRLLERIAERDYYQTEQDIYYKDDFSTSLELKKKLRKLRSRDGWVASYAFWDPKKNKIEEFKKSQD